MRAIRTAVSLSGVEEGTRLEVEGLAESIQGHAVLRLDRPGARVSINGLDRWPKELHGRPVAVEGALAYDGLLPGLEMGLSGMVILASTWSAVPERGTTIIAGTQLIAAEGTRVVLEGVALDAHASALVALFGDVVFIPDLHSWDGAFLDGKVRVEGRLVSGSYSDEPCPFPGAVTGALWGKRWSIEDATWTIAGAAQP